MSNWDVKVNLLKIKGGALVNLKGKTATKECIVIPVEDAGLFKGEKGVYLDLVAWEHRDQKYEDTHYLKLSVKKEVWDALTDEQKRAFDICGGMKPKLQQSNAVQAASTMEVQSDGSGEDLPF